VIQAQTDLTEMGIVEKMVWLMVDWHITTTPCLPIPIKAASQKIQIAIAMNQVSSFNKIISSLLKICVFSQVFN